MKPSPGSLSPFQSSSSNHSEQSDNYTEYYVKGGDNMENKALDVDNSTTVDRGYSVNTSTEPDPNSELAMQKEATYTKPATLQGEGTYSTTANSRNEEPVAGDTTEPIEKAAQCCDNACGNCKGPGCGCCADCKKAVEKADACDCGKEDCKMCMGMIKATDQQDDGDDSEPDDDEDDLKKNYIQKSVWGGAFSPYIR